MADTPAPAALALAKFRSDDDLSPKIEFEVQFNPASLQYTVSNKEQGQGPKKKQHVSETSAQLSMDLVFDSTDTGKDVRWLTERVLKLLSPANKSKAPRALEFSWGVYAFKGLIEQYKETLDFFSADGVPLRSTVSLTLTAKELTFAKAPDPNAKDKEAPALQLSPPNAPSPSPADVSKALGKPRAARAIAAANGAPSLRFSSEGGLALSAGAGLEAGAAFGAGAGFAAGAGLEAGAGFGADVTASGGVTLLGAAAFSAGASVGAGLGASAGGGIGIGSGLSAGAGIGISAGAGVSASAGFGAGVSAGAGFSAGAGAVAGGAFGGLRASAAITVAIPDPTPLIEIDANVSVGAGVQFGPGGRALSVESGASLSADVGADVELTAGLTFTT